eukprot:10016322-Lingulodinium_polyedra.AAC.1
MGRDTQVPSELGADDPLPGTSVAERAVDAGRRARGREARPPGIAEQVRPPGHGQDSFHTTVVERRIK